MRESFIKAHLLGVNAAYDKIKVYVQQANSNFKIKEFKMAAAAILNFLNP